MRSTRRAILLGLTSVILQVGCGSDGGGSSEPEPEGFSGTVPTPSALSSFVSEVRGADGGRSASVTPVSFARVFSPPSETAEIDVLRPYTGRQLSTSATSPWSGGSVDGERFIAQDDLMFLAIEDGDCHLVFDDPSGVRGLVSGPCDGESGLVCAYSSNVACVYCEAGECTPCTVDGEGAVSCDPFPEPEPEPEPDAGIEDVMDTPDVVEDVGEPDTVEADAGGGDDVAEDAPEPIDIVVEDVGEVSEQPECSSACLEEQGGECCLDCGCRGGNTCVPECGGGYEWDCALGCCYNYDLLRCSCPESAPWDAEQACCASGGACIE